METLYPSGDYEQYVYNGDGTLSSKAVWDDSDVKQWIDYYYDSYGRIEDVNYPDDGNIHYDYDGFGRKTQVADNRNATDNIGGDGTIGYQYDALDRITKITDHDDWVIEYGYMSDGQKSQIKVTEPSSDQVMYHIAYLYDKSLRLEYVSEPLNGTTTGWIAGLGYDDNGNRDSLTYYRDGTLGGNTTAMSYTYNGDNRLTTYTTTGGVTFSLSNTTVDGLGRLIEADETLTDPNGNPVTHALDYAYDMRSQLLSADITNIGGSTWSADYDYDKAGNVTAETVAGTNKSFTYDGDLMTAKGNDSLTWDENGRMITGVTSSLTYNDDSKLQSGSAGGVSVDLKYDTDGNRIWREVDDGQTTKTRKYIVDIAGDLPVILLEIDTSQNDPNDQVVKTYIYANSDILSQHDGYYGDDQYFYLNDRLGSVRQIIDVNASVEHLYSYGPFGKKLEDSEDPDPVSNAFCYTGQYLDSEIGQYYLRARQFDLAIYRFASRDASAGSFSSPSELHRYLYCLNNPVNRTDLSGMVSKEETATTVGTGATISTGGHAYIRQALQRVQDLMAQISVRNFTQQLATTGKKGLEMAVRMGKNGEYFAQKALNFAKNTDHYYTQNGNYRIPDGVSGNIFFEVKNVAKLSNTAQLRDLLQIAQDAGGQLILVVRQGDLTTLSGPLKTLVDGGQILLAPILP